MSAVDTQTEDLAREHYENLTAARGARRRWTDAPEAHRIVFRDYAVAVRDCAERAHLLRQLSVIVP